MQILVNTPIIAAKILEGEFHEIKTLNEPRLNLKLKGTRREPGSQQTAIAAS